MPRANLSLRQADELRIRLSWQSGWKFCLAPSGPFDSPCHALIHPSEIRWAQIGPSRIPVCQMHWQILARGATELSTKERDSGDR
jgi:hypothetical protein